MGAEELDQILFGRAKWRLVVLVPTWAASIAMLLSLMGIFAYRLAETIENWEDNGKQGSPPQVELAWECTNIAFSLVSLILTIVEISKYANELLTPFFMIGSQILKLTLSFAILALDIVSFLQRTDGIYSTIGLAIDVVQIAVMIASLLYALATYRRVLKFEDFHLAGAHKFGSWDDRERELGNVVHVSGGNGKGCTRAASVIEDPSVSYQSQTTALRSEVDLALGAEFGWTSKPGARGGEVHAGMPETSSSHMPRTQSWMSQKGVVGTAEEDDDETETVRGSHDGPRQGHSRIPSVVISEHGNEGHDEEDDTRALLAAHEGDIGDRSMDTQYRDHQGSAS